MAKKILFGLIVAVLLSLPTSALAGESYPIGSVQAVDN